MSPSLTYGVKNDPILLTGEGAEKYGSSLLQRDDNDWVSRTGRETPKRVGENEFVYVYQRNNIKVNDINTPSRLKTSLGLTTWKVISHPLYYTESKYSGVGLP